MMEFTNQITEPRSQSLTKMVEIKIYFLFYFVVVWGGDRERAEWAKCVEYQHEDMCWIAYTLLKAEHSSSDL